MNILIEWDNDEKNIIRWTFTEGWTWNDFFTASTQTESLLDELDHRVDFISDFSNSPMVPDQVFSNFSDIDSIPQFNHANAGILVIAGASIFVRTVVGVFKKAYRDAGSRVRLAKNIDDAREIIAEDRSLIAANN